MPKLNDFLKSLIVKAGGNLDSENIKTALGNLGADLEIGDDIVTAIDNGLLSLKDAKNNFPELKNHYFGQAYKGLDAELESLIQSEKLPEEVITELKQETSSTKRAAKLALKLKELEAKKSASNSKGDTQKLNEQIVELNNQLRAEKDAKAALETQHKTNLKNFKIDVALRQLLGTYKTTQDNLSPETKSLILSSIISNHLKTKNAAWEMDDNDNLILAGANGTNLFTDDNRPLTPKTFIDKVLTDEKLLVVTDNSNNNNGNNNNNSYRPTNNNGGQYNSNRANGQYNDNGNHNNGGQRRANPVLQELIQKSQKDIEKSENGGIKVM